MPCDTRKLETQTWTERKQEVRDAISALSAALATGRAKAVIDRVSGAIAFQGWPEGREGRVTDSCAYRILMATGSALAKAAIAKAEMLAGKTVSRQALHAGVHSHDGGHSFHRGH